MAKKKNSFDPFKIFRKNQVAWLAALGILTMVSFIILPAIMQMMPGGVSYEGQQGGNIATTRHHGKVDPQLLDNLRRNHENLARFYSGLLREIIGANPSVLTSQAQQARLALLATRADQYDKQISNEELINRWMLARYSEDQGITINSKMIIEQLGTITADLLTKQILSQVIEGLNLSEQYVEYLLSEEIRYHQIFYMFLLSQNATLPATKWEWFQRLNKKTTLEVAALPVTAFTDKVIEPTNAQIKRFFDENKKRQFDPTLPDTGFTSPKQIAFSYIRGVPSQKMLDSITKEDIEKYYAENKEAFRKPLQPKKDLPELPGMSPNNFQINEAIPNFNLNQPTGLGNIRNNLSGLGILNGSGNNTPTTPTPETQPEIQPTEQPAENKPTTDNEKNENNNETNSALNIRYNNSSKQHGVKFVSFQNEPTTETTEPVASQPTEKIDETAETKPVDEKPADEKTTNEKPADEPVDTKPETEKASNDELDILYRPLSEVENDIRRHLAQVKINEILTKIEDKLRVHYDIYRKYIDQKMENPNAAIVAPAKPDFSAIIAEHDLEVVSEELGTIFDIMHRSEFVRGETERMFIVNWFKGRPYEYQAHKIGNDYSQILIWATDFKNEITPENIDDNTTLRETVIKRWKEVQARDIAFKAAQEFAETARKANEPLNVVFASKSDLLSVTETEPFSWLTYGYSIDEGSPIYLSEVREKGVRYGEAESGNKYIFAPGEDFMRTVSTLEIGEINTVFNQPKSTVYIVKLISTSPSEESLWENFKTAQPYSYLQVGQKSIFENREAWLESIRAEMDFKWINKPTEDEMERR
ncbi:MAG: hypothetical protein LBI18_13235 [Planctomycetaceae bacterium]|jgi:hypothetical protein|nr:hypothetical protein [Planctomycetaceae bacterium]